ncbi:MAG: efflux RND transporter periplasmic adaptor subunit [Opitutales bacterium]
MLRIKSIPAAAGIVFVLFLTACGQRDIGKKQGPPPAVSVERIEPETFIRRIELTGSVEPTRVATLSSPAEGPVMNCAIREGDAVEDEEVLLRIGRDESAVASLSAAREELERHKREFERTKALVEEKALPAEQLDMARSNLENARAALAGAQQVSLDYDVRAPWPGLVSRVHVADGKYVAPRTPLVDLFDPASLVLRFQVPEQHALAVKEGDSLQARFDAFPDQSHDLRVARAYPELDRRLRQRTFEASLPLETHDFQPGFFGRIRVELERVEQALTVPVEALDRNPEGKTVVYTVAEGKATVREVETGFEQNGRILVREGLASGDAVIVRGIERVSAGTKVRLADANETSGEDE